MRAEHLPAKEARETAAAELENLLALNNQLCFTMYAATNAITRAYRSALSEIGLTFPQYLALLVLWENDALSVSELGVRLRLDSGTLTPLLKRLEQAGLVARARRSDDERIVEIRLTDAGRAIRDEAVTVRASVVCRTGMSDAEIGRLRGDLWRLLEQLDGSGSKTSEIS
jgi:DNA-binding MarR family transcriptional regulator